jgi:histidinol phosphatase-like PHP family hydrolase
LQKNPPWPLGIKGDLQVHTNWSDGSGSIAEMVEAARQLNYQYQKV